MKVLHLSTFDRFGAAMGCIRLHQALLSAGVDSYLVTLHKTRSDLRNHFSYADQNESKALWDAFSLAAMREKREKNFLDQMKVWTAKKNLYFSGVSSRYKDIPSLDLFKSADLINLHWVAGFLDWRSFWKSVGKKKIVWRLSDVNPFSGAWHYKDEKILDDITIEQKRDFQKFEQYCLQIKKKIFMRHKPDMEVVTPSVWLKELAENCDLFQDVNIQSIPSSVDTNSFSVKSRSCSRQQLALEVNLPTFIFVSSELNDYRKGYDLLKDALLRYSGNNIQFITVGSLRKEEKISNPKVLHRHYDQIDDTGMLASLYNAADWTLIPSRQDNLPNVFLESVACATPVLASKVGGIEDFMPDAELGYLVPSNEWLENIVSASNSLKYDREKIRDFAVKNFSADVQAQQYITLYEQLLVA